MLVAGGSHLGVLRFLLRRLNLIADGGQNAFRVMRSGDGFSSFSCRED